MPHLFIAIMFVSSLRAKNNSLIFIIHHHNIKSIIIYHLNIIMNHASCPHFAYEKWRQFANIIFFPERAVDELRARTLV